jgi:HEPN domain-containing protein
LLRDGGIDYAVSAKFHAQQAVEKCLKAAIVITDTPAPFTHDLKDLTKLAVSSGLQPPFNPEDLDKLTPYAVMMRYDDEEITILSYSEATRIVNGVYKWARSVVVESK